MTTHGRATPEGTARYAKSHAAADGHYRSWRGLTLSSVGLGSYLGEESQTVDRGLVDSALHYLASGINVLDTASVYRRGRSEIALGDALRFYRGSREEYLVATKGGFIAPGPGVADARRWFEETYLATGLLTAADVAGGSHAMTPGFLLHELATSLHRLGLAAVDVYFVHNPEAQLQAGVPRDEFDRRLRAAFVALEEAADAGRIGVYGLATWFALRVPPEDPNHVSLERAIELARDAREEVGGDPDEHHFGAIELPVNLAMPEGVAAPTQEWRGRRVSAAVAAVEAGFLVLSSASIGQRRLFREVPAHVREALGALDGDALAALQFARSAPGVTSALVGTTTPAHARENAAIVATPPAPDAAKGLLDA